MIDTPWGRLTLEIGVRGLRRVIFDGPACAPLEGDWARILMAYLAQEPIPADLPIDLDLLSPFTRRVLTACRALPFGAIVTYGHLAAEIGCPRSARAVGQALARNPVPVVIPCHRVVGGNGTLTGFLGGLRWKQALLAHEGLDISHPGGFLR